MVFPHAESAGLRAKNPLKLLALLGISFGLLLAVAPVQALAGPMITGGLTSQPIGHYEFCRLNPGECDIRSRNTSPMHMTDALWQEIADVNRAINIAVVPMNDIDTYGQDEVWAYPHGRGDCEDYVLEKRRQLADLGVSLTDLLITVVRKPDGEGHAVLTLRSDEGDFILDNLTDIVLHWEETGYRFLKRQSTGNTGQWVAIRSDQTPLVGAVQ